MTDDTQKVTFMLACKAFVDVIPADDTSYDELTPEFDEAVSSFMSLAPKTYHFLNSRAERKDRDAASELSNIVDLTVELREAADPTSILDLYYRTSCDVEKSTELYWTIKHTAWQDDPLERRQLLDTLSEHFFLHPLPNDASSMINSLRLQALEEELEINDTDGGESKTDSV